MMWKIVQHQQARLGHQRPADGEHLALAARERARQLAAPFLEPGEGAEYLGHGGRLVAVAGPIALESAEQQVVLDAHFAEQLALFRHQGHAHGHLALDLHVPLLPAHELDLPGAGQQAHDRREHGGLAGAVRSDHRGDLARADAQAGVVQCLDLAVGHAQVAHLERGAHPSGPAVAVRLMRVGGLNRPRRGRPRARPGRAGPARAAPRRSSRRSPSPPRDRPGP